MKLVHDHVGPVQLLPVLHRHVGENFRRTADHGSGPVDAGVPGEHPDVFRAKFFAEIEEAFTDEGLDGSGIERAFPLAERAEVESQCDQ